MSVKIKRKIVKIDEEKCNGCGLCAPSCAEGALKIIDGKARLISEVYCDGLGACLGECPQGAIAIEERVAEEFDEEAVKEYLEIPLDTPQTACSAANIARLLDNTLQKNEVSAASMSSMLRNWPVQLALIPPNAPFLQNADVVIAADCVAFAYPALHRDFLKDNALIVACPKLDDTRAHLEKLTAIFEQSSVKSVKILRMVVPCCSGLVQLTRLALQASSKNIPVEEVVIDVKGEILSPV